MAYKWMDPHNMAEKVGIVGGVTPVGAVDKVRCPPSVKWNQAKHKFQWKIQPVQGGT